MRRVCGTDTDTDTDTDELPQNSHLSIVLLKSTSSFRLKKKLTPDLISDNRLSQTEFKYKMKMKMKNT